MVWWAGGGQEKEGGREMSTCVGDGPGKHCSGMETLKVEPALSGVWCALGGLVEVCGTSARVSGKCFDEARLLALCLGGAADWGSGQDSPQLHVAAFVSEVSAAGAGAWRGWSFTGKKRARASNPREEGGARARRRKGELLFHQTGCCPCRNKNPFSSSSLLPCACV